MTRDEFKANEMPLRALLDFIGSVALISVISSFVVYGLAIWIWVSGDNVSAMLVAILGYLFFRMHRKFAIWLARRKFAGDDGFGEACELLRRDVLRLGDTRLLTELGAYADENPENSPPA